ncbi:MAG TPA: TonB-dependent receptor [Gemmatimonadales bacterium]|nr:TonB-dependent receptor [Gemmatimonadales bacterium]
MTRGALGFVLLSLASSPFGGAWAQAPRVPDDTTGDRPRRVYQLSEVIVTATRTEKPVFATPSAASVVDHTLIKELAPNSATDVLRALPGVDVTGVGPNQARPAIRGQRGQRILMLEDGLRLNNSRRQQDFGELPALVDVNAVERVEIVRGPASVLYGSDAIGGVVNMITRVPTRTGVSGSAGYRYSTHDKQQRVTGSLAAGVGPWTVSGSGTFRQADPYQAPAGTFGQITLAGQTPVVDTDAQDHSFNVRLGYRPSGRHDLGIKFERYQADTTGFGWVDPQAYAPQQPIIQILYPDQRFDKLSVTYVASDLGFPLADRVNVAGYRQDNQRHLAINIRVPFGPTSGMLDSSRNFTDLETYGFRLEATKLAASRVMFTYGVDFFRDRSVNTDSGVTRFFGLGPIPARTRTVPQVPNATFRSAGAFVQGDVQVTNRASLILGGRYQDVQAATQATTGIPAPLVTLTDRTVVGSANALYRVTNEVVLVGSVGRAFRSPNLVERFFDGVTPEGAAYQAPNPGLAAETSLNLDLGVRVSHARVSAEGFVFRNMVRDGIRIAPRGDTLRGLPVFWNVNVDKLRFQGVELGAEVVLPGGFLARSGYTHLTSKDVLNPNNPVGDSFSRRLTGGVRYSTLAERVWLGYEVRHNWERRDVQLGTSPIGPVLPAFTTHGVRGGVTVFRRGGHVQRLGMAVNNLTNALYAEFPNASFFRPEPGRSVVLTWDVTF